MDEMQKQLGNMVDELKEGKRQMISQQLDPSSTTNYKIQFLKSTYILVFYFCFLLKQGPRAMNLVNISKYQ